MIGPGGPRPPVLAAAVFLLGCHAERGPYLATVSSHWKLVWWDEFTAPAIDLSRWEYEVNGQGGGNNELQYYTARPRNAFIREGGLVIRALKEDYAGPDGPREFTSARIRTSGRGDWTYGRIEARARMPEGQGLWPAIWMLPTDTLYGGWAASGEIDIVELVGHEPNRIYGTVHFGGRWPANVHEGGSWTLPAESFSDDFHLFAVEWDPAEIRWYVDGHNYHTQADWWSEGGPFPAPFDHDFHLLLNVAVGGNWPGLPDTTTVFPQEMVVDYIHVFQRPE